MASKRNSSLVIHAIRSVCETFGTDPADSAVVLRRALEPDHLQRHGHEELKVIARHVNKQLRLDPEFVRDLYIAAFSWKDKSDHETLMGSSQILPLKSTKKQDYWHAQWALAEVYPKYLETAPKAAAVAMIAAIEAYTRDERKDSKELWASILKKRAVVAERSAERAEAVQTFRVNDTLASLRLDDSHFYDRNWSAQDEQPLRLLNDCFRYLESAASNGGSDRFFEIIDVLITTNRLGLIWSRLLRLAGEHDFLALHLKDMAWAQPLLLAPATEESMPTFLKRLYSLLGEEDKEKILQYITALPAVVTRKERDGAVRRRDLLLKSISGLGVEANTPRNRGSEDAGPITRKAAEALVGGFGYSPRSQIARSKPKRQSRLQVIKERVSRFASVHTNQQPSLSVAQATLADLRELQRLRKHSSPEAPDQNSSGSASAFLAAACAKIAGIRGLTPKSALGKFVSVVLCGLANDKEPVPRRGDAEQFDRSRVSGWPQTRIEVARGLLQLSGAPGFINSALLTALDRLARDRAAVVRYEIAANCWVLHESATQHMWKWLTRFSRDSSTSVREIAIHSLHRLAAEYPRRAVPLIISALHTTPPHKTGGDQVIKSCMEALLRLYVWKDDLDSRTEVNAVLANVIARHKEAGNMLFVLRDALTHGSTTADQKDHAIRKRAVDLLITLVGNTTKPIRHILEKSRAGQELTAAEQEEFHALAKLANIVAKEVFFASGAHQPNNFDMPSVIQRPEQERFYREVGDIFDNLAIIGLPGLAYDLVLTLEMFIPVDPAEVFLRIGAVVSAGQRWGYQYEDLAQDLIVRIVQRYVAEYRVLLQQNRGCQTVLRQTLEIFITAASPTAQALAYKVDEIFRQ